MGIEQVFGYRADFRFGNSDTTIPAAKKENIRCDVVHIDGAHSKVGVTNDLKNLKNISNKNALILLDDYDWSGVKQAIDDVIKENNLISIESIINIDDKIPQDWMA